MSELLSFTAKVVPGAGRGKGMGTPTLNVDLHDVPASFQEGIYACTVQFDSEDSQKIGALHYGPRPVFDNSVACEIHVLDELIEIPPSAITITIRERLRDVRNFKSPEALQEQIATDIQQIRSIMEA